MDWKKDVLVLRPGYSGRRRCVDLNCDYRDGILLTSSRRNILIMGQLSIRQYLHPQMNVELWQRNRQIAKQRAKIAGVKQ
jgi:hypothetical protein